MKKLTITLLFTFTSMTLRSLWRPKRRSFSLNGALAIMATGASLIFGNCCNAQSFAQSTFDSLSTGMTSPGAYVLALAMKDSVTENLFAGGHFKIAGRKTAVNIAEWMDTASSYPPVKGKWIALGTGADSDVCAMAMSGKYLYAGGKFDTAGGIACSHIARWDTAAKKWDSLAGTLNGNVYALCVYHGALYVGGDFTLANRNSVNRIAVWKDTMWAQVGAGFDSGAVYALTVSNDTLYAGGSFLKSNNVKVNYIAKLSGNNWDSVGGGTNNTVYALADLFNSELCAGGAFTKSENTLTKYISYFDYTSRKWNAFGPGTNDTVRALNAGGGALGLIIKKTGQGWGGGNILFVGGNFDSAGGYGSHYIAAIQYGVWDTIGGLNGPVYALANPFDYFNGDNFTGGKFSVAKNYFNFSKDTVNNIAYLNIFLGGGIPTIGNKSLVDVYPNPGNGLFTVTLSHAELVSASQTKIEIYNVMGQKVTVGMLNPPTGGQHDYELNLSDQPSGIYLYRVLGENGELIGEGKLVIEK